MRTFLQQIIAELKSDYGKGISELCIVVPTRRAVEFLREAIREEYRESIWAPKMLSIQDFVRGISGREFPETMPLVFELYKVYLDRMREDNPSFYESLESFYAWGEMLVKDFDEIDKYLVNAGDLFRNIRELKEIDEFFHLDELDLEPIRRFWETLQGKGKDLTEVQEQFLKIWQVLHDIYKGFREKLNSESYSYDGMAYRNIIGLLEEGKLELPYPQIIFVGFNALSRAEEKLMELLLKEKRARVYWDVDQAYFTLKKEALMTGEEPGKFIQEYHKKWKDIGSHLIVHDMMNEEKNVYHTGVPLEVGQAQYLGNLLRDNKIAEEDFRKTALVLADEKLLFPVLYALPSHIDKLNITMGFPLRQTNVFNLLMSVMRLLRNMRREKNELSFSHKDVSEILNNPYVKSAQTELSEEIQFAINKHNWVYISGKELKKRELDDLLKHIFSPPDFTTRKVDLKKLLDYCKGVFDYLLTDAQVRQNYLETEYIFKFSLSFNQLQDVLLKYKPDLSMLGFTRLFREVVQKLRIPFEGEPLEGVQLMGFLETRVLDFEKVYILAANEGNLPDTSSGNSFIPYNLRKGFGLPTYEEKDAIYAYHFYRLLQRTKEVHLIYNSVVSDSTGSAKELSRFIRQIRHFFRQQNNFHIHEGLVSTAAPFSEQASIEIASDIDTKRLFRGRFSGGGRNYLSATALNTWISCSLKFYFKYLARIKEADEVEESMQANTLGTVLHEAMEELYKPHAGKEVDEKLIDNLLKSVDRVVADKFVENGLGKVEDLQGKNLLLHRVIMRLCSRMLKQDKESQAFQVIGLEADEFEQKLEVAGQHFAINGSLDRVDQLSETKSVRILDYKTGKVALNNRADLDKIFSDSKNKEMFQGYLYAWLYRRKFPDARVKVGYYTARHLSDGIQFLRQGAEIGDMELQAFESKLFVLIERMYTENYTQTEDESKCSYCPYNAICNRRTN
ncbi:MAG: PD-(D/E)XK nuclease family protein [Bacteroidia bacterium]|nr:PD-(D/E)XK nuclease family protein [Bacteroidia bacterium]